MKNVDKTRMDLIDAEALLEEAKVMTFGAGKYEPRSWEAVIRRGESWRYIASAHRHLNAIQRGEVNDPETGLSHAAHLACNAHFLSWASLHGFLGAQPKELFINKAPHDEAYERQLEQARRRQDPDSRQAQEGGTYPAVKLEKCPECLGTGEDMCAPPCTCLSCEGTGRAKP